MKFFFSKLFLVICSCFFVVVSFAQPGTSIDLENDKPEKYKEKLLNSEKTPDKKIGFLKRFTANTVTHYNYYYNTGLKVFDVYERAKQNWVDDYTQLLPFYNYSFATTAKDKDIDSIIYKCNAGILLHDLRTDWVDDMYLYLGMAYMFKQKFDSAHHVFQYLNYVYAPKQDGYDVAIGSNESNEEGIFTIATNEKKRKLLDKIFRYPTKRNDALIWLVKNYLAQNKSGEASGLLQMIQYDSYFPSRLKTDIYEVLSHNFYQIKQYDSAAHYLIKALPNAFDRLEKARWEFLAGQMYQLSNEPELANKQYKKAITHSTNPLLELNAYFNMILGLQDSTSNRKSTATITEVPMLQKLAKKERFEPYRDIIYYNIGKIQENDNDLEAAIVSYKKSTTTSTENPKQKSKSFAALADAEYKLKHYKLAYSYYDSVVIADVDEKTAARVNERKPALKIIVTNSDAIYLQDSLQALAKLEPKELNTVLKKVYKNYLKEKGLKDDAANNSFDFGSDNSASDNNSNSFDAALKPGEYYFDNESMKVNGAKEFKSKWGNRPNVDNWNRASAAGGNFNTSNDNGGGNNNANNKANTARNKATKSIANNKKKQEQRQDNNIDNQDLASMFGNPDQEQLKPQDEEQGADMNVDANKPEEKEVTAESLFSAVPLDKEKLDSSNSIIIESLLGNGQTFSDKLEDYISAIEAYEELLRRFPKIKNVNQVAFNLSYLYQKAGKPNRLSKFNIDIANIDMSKLGNNEKDEATKKYAGIYNKFLEGKYNEAEQEKIEADSLYQGKYWSSQLSFIESVHYIKQRQDSVAIDRLNLIVNGTADKALQEKAKLMIDILKRRKEIEEHLAKLDSNGRYDSNSVAKNQAYKDSVDAANAAKNKDKIFDDYTKDLSLVGKPFIFNPNEPHYAVLLLEKVDDVFLLETKKSFDKYNRENFGGNPPQLKLAKLNKDYTLVLMGPLINASECIGYIDVTKPKTIKVLPWLPVFKYTYTMIGISNVDILRVNDNLADYKKFLKKHFPGKF